MDSALLSLIVSVFVYLVPMLVSIVPVERQTHAVTLREGSVEKRTNTCAVVGTKLELHLW